LHDGLLKVKDVERVEEKREIGLKKGQKKLV